MVGYAINGHLYYVYNDHLGRSEKITNAVRSTVWSANNFDFDRSIGLDLIDGYNLGFPGQYWDEETELYYNYFRDYDPKVGRYVQSDPIRLRAGVNTYAYVSANPVTFIDPFGLAKICYRPLDSWATPVVIGNPGSQADIDNNIVGHQHILFDDGSNIGFEPDGLFSEEGREGEYSKCESGFDDEKLKEAVAKTPTGKYDFFWKDNNCQDWVSRVLTNYNNGKK